MIKATKKLIGRLVRNEDGATAVEYAILVGAIALALGGAATSFTGELTTKLAAIL